MCIDVKVFKRIVLCNIGDRQLLAVPKTFTVKESKFYYVDVRVFVNTIPTREGLCLRLKEFVHLYYAIRTGKLDDFGIYRKLAFEKLEENLKVTLSDKDKTKSYELPKLAQVAIVDKADEIVNCFPMDHPDCMTALMMHLGKRKREELYDFPAKRHES